MILTLSFQEEDLAGNLNKSLDLSQASSVSVGQFYRRLLFSRGEILDQLTRGEICLARDIQLQDYVAILDTLAKVLDDNMRSLQPDLFRNKSLLSSISSWRVWTVLSSPWSRSSMKVSTPL